MADEVENLRKIISSVAEFQSEQQSLKEQMETGFMNKSFGYSSEESAPWWWPFK